MKGLAQSARHSIFARPGRDRRLGRLATLMGGLALIVLALRGVFLRLELRRDEGGDGRRPER